MTGRSYLTLIVDDEPEYLSWIADYLSTFGMATEYARTIPEALERLAKKTYGLLIIDMNIPVGGAAGVLARSKSPAAEKYPGILLALHARSKGYKASQVIAYTVHDDDAADAELAKLDCRYVLKGRPEELKEAIRTTLRGKKERGK